MATSTEDTGAGKIIGRLAMVDLSATIDNQWSAATLHDGPGRVVIWDQGRDQYIVKDAGGAKLAWTELHPGKIHRVRLGNGELLPGFSIQKGWWSRYKLVSIGTQEMRPVLMLEGRIRAMGNDLLRIEHRDYQSEVTYICTPEMEMGALILSFLVFNTPNCRG